jgi:Na+/H+-dicarboxylate symporter
LAVVLFEQLQNMIPPNPFEAVATGNFLSIIAFSLAFGVCTILVGGATAQRINALVDAAFQVMMKLTMLIIRIAPLGVFFLMLSATASQGAGVFSTLGWYILAVACALALHAVVVLPVILHFVAKRSPIQFAQAMSPALLTAFSSASSNGTLPLTLTCVEQRAHISNRVGSFVLPLGATINMDGTALYEVVAVLFIAQFSGVDLPLSQQIVVAFTALLASIGAAGIPHAGLVMMVIILQAVGLPTESQGLIIAVDRVLDMCRTAVNVWSDSCGCAVVSRFESQGDRLDPPPMAPAGDVDI